MRSLAAALVAALYIVVASGCASAPQAMDTLPPLTAQPGDAAKGRAIVADRRAGLCLLCHSAPIAEERFQGNLAPDLAGAGTRWNAAQLRLRVANSKRLNPESIMPSYLQTEGFNRVGTAWAGKPVLSPQQVEDVVAYLETLK
jgi:sulfur-oxidizing protein SoxX